MREKMTRVGLVVTIIGLLSLLCLQFALVPSVLAQVEPSVTSISLVDYPGGSPVTSMDPQVEYNVKVTVTVADPNTLDDLDTVTVTIFYDDDGDNDAADVPGTGNTQTAAILTWTNATPNTWTIDAISGGGTWSIEDTNCVEPTLTGSSGTFEFHFKPGRVATEATDWDIYAKADDGGGTPGTLYDAGDYDMNWYGEVAALTGGPVGFPSMSLGDTGIQCTGAVSATYIANGNYNQQIKTDSGAPDYAAKWVSAGANEVLLEETEATPGAGEFVLKADDDATVADAVQVQTTYTTFDTGIQTDEDGWDETNNYLWLSLGGEGIAADTYNGTIYYRIAP